MGVEGVYLNAAPFSQFDQREHMSSSFGCSRTCVPNGPISVICRELVVASLRARFALASRPGRVHRLGRGALSMSVKKAELRKR